MFSIAQQHHRVNRALAVNQWTTVSQEQPPRCIVVAQGFMFASVVIVEHHVSLVLALLLLCPSVLSTSALYYEISGCRSSSAFPGEP